MKEWASLTCQNCSQGLPAEKTGRGSLLNRPSCPPDDLIGQGTELLRPGCASEYSFACFAYCQEFCLSNLCFPTGFMWWGCCALCQRREPTELALSFLFYCCVYFCLYGPFKCISFYRFSRQLSAFSFCSSSLPYHHHHQSLNREGRCITTNGFTTPFFSVLRCPLGLGKLQGCPLPDVVFPPSILSALSFSSFHCALPDGCGQT